MKSKLKTKELLTQKSLKKKYIPEIDINNEQRNKLKNLLN